MNSKLWFVVTLLSFAVGTAFAQIEEFRPMDPIGPLPSLASPPIDTTPPIDLRQPPIDKPAYSLPAVIVAPPPPTERREESADCEVYEEKCQELCIPLPQDYSSYERCVRTLCKIESENCIEKI